MNRDESNQPSQTTAAPASLLVTSSALKEGDAVPRDHSGEGHDLSPPLAWSGAPADVKEYALIAHDPDAPVGVWYHWILYNIPGDLTEIPSGLEREAVLHSPIQARQGLNSWQSNNLGYRGPMPPKGHGPHRYFFTVYALDKHIELAPQLATAEGLRKEMQGHVVAAGQLMGTYERK